MNDSSYISWSNDSNKDNAFNLAGENYLSYDGVKTHASHRSFIDIEPNISVRPQYAPRDYYAFREAETPATSAKRAMAQCMRAYDRVGIIKNIIDLMGDFASQGITIHHENPKTQAFYRKWWSKVSGSERSERFLNLLYRSGNVMIYKRYGKVNKIAKREMSKANDIELNKIKVYKGNIPLKYDFLNPLMIDIENNQGGLFADTPSYILRLNKKPQGMKEKESVYSTLPSGDNGRGNYFIKLDPERLETFFYKKDDWQIWANPMINAIIDDITMLEKMKLADMSALDGAISNIRLWRLGNLEHKILPNRATIDKLRNILASNVGGGTMDLVWGPEIDFKESNTQIYKFLGDQKYIPVLNSIYAGLGIPPTLTGLAGQSGGFTNNFISLKTLVERLEYGRDLLNKFWMKEIEYVNKAMGFTNLPELHFSHMVLSDEAAEKNLLIQLADRDIISTKTLRERFGELDTVESYRINKEEKLREKGKMPPKANPYHNDQEHEYKKMALQKGEIGIDDVTDLKPKPVTDTGQDMPEKKQVQDGGRPKLSRDVNKRKQKRVLPRSKATTLIWATEAQKIIADILHPALLNHYGKKNLRELSRAEATELEDIKFSVLCNYNPHDSITLESVLSILDSKAKIASKFNEEYKQLCSDFTRENDRYPTVDEVRQIQVMSYCFAYFSEI